MPLRPWLLAVPCLLLPAAARAQQLDPVRHQAFVARHHTERYQVQQPAVLGDPRVELGVQISLRGASFQLELRPHSLRGPDFAVLIAGEDGEVLLDELPPAATFRGLVRDPADGRVVGRVAASDRDQDLRVYARLDDGRSFELHPVPGVTAATGPRRPRHAAFWTHDTTPPAGTCGPSLDGFHAPRAVEPPRPAPRAQSRGLGPLHQTDIAFDADFSYFQANGSSITATILDVEDVLNSVELIYENQLDITYEITLIVIRTSDAADPYNTNDPSSLLSAFQGQWVNKFRGVNKDVTHLMTGRNLNGSTIGIAFLDALCSNRGYGLSQTFFSGNMNARAALTAHELGHNWNASHCNGDPDCSIMCAGLGGCTGNITTFGQRSLGSISGLRDFVNCLSDVVFPAPPLPIFDDFEASTLDPSLWSYNRRASLSANGVNEPSGVQSVKLNSIGPGIYQDDDLRSNVLDLSAASDLDLSFLIEQRGPENNETMRVEYFAAGDNSQTWSTLGNIQSDGTVQTEYRYHRFPLPPDAYHPEFRFRFRPDGDQTNDSWFLDDVRLAEGGLILTVEELVAGTTAELNAYGADPLEQVYFIYGLLGTGSGACFFGGAFCIDLLGQVFILGAPPADADGRATAFFTIPGGLPPISVSTQAVVVRGPGGVDSQKTNAVERTVVN